MKCLHDNCEITPTRQHFAQHMKICPRRLVECEFCSMRVTHSDLDAHFAECNQRPSKRSRNRRCRPVDLEQDQDLSTSLPISDMMREHQQLIMQKEETITSLQAQLASVEEKDETIASLQAELADIKSRPTISHHDMNKYPLLVDRCHCCEDVEAWNELNALADAGDKVALAYTIVVLGADSGAGTVMCQNMAKAKKIGVELKTWLLDEHDDHNVHATYILGYLSFRGMSKLHDGMELFQIAAAQGHIGAMNWVAFGLINKKEGRKGKRSSSSSIAVGLLQECMSKGLLEAKFDMANLLVDGAEGYCVTNEKLAFVYYKELADVNYLPAMVNLGQCYENGTGMRTANIKLAYYYFKKAADMGDRVAQCNVGVFYCRGSGVKIDKVTGRKYLKKSIAQGYKEAQAMLDIAGE